MKYNIKRNWYSAFMLMAKSPVVFLPFVFIAFFEAVSAEKIYFSVRWPLSVFAGPIIRKFFGEAYLHYPANLLILPKLFYYAQIAIYVFLGIFLTAISVNIFNSLKAGLPVKAKAMINNAAKNYIPYAIYGIIMVALIIFLRKFDSYIFTRAMRLVMKLVPGISPQLRYLALMIFMFMTNIVMQVFLILTVPLMVIEKKGLLKAILNSITLGFRNFFTLFKLVFLPFIAYLPITLLKGISTPLADKTLPEMNLIVVFASIIASIFLDSFVIICVSQFVLDIRKSRELGAGSSGLGVTK